MISPLDAKNNDFKIFLSISRTNDTEYKEIKPFPIVDFFDYKITGKITADGTGELIYSCQKEPGLVEIVISFDYYNPTNCGDLAFDFRVYDRESEALNEIVQRTKNIEDSPLEKKDIRALLDTYHGIGVFRNGFRIRPLGDAGYDWMNLNLERVNNPSMRISVNQIIGYVKIQPEEQSNLYEKSARDGLRDNEAYKNLIEISKRVLKILEENRYRYRQLKGKSRKKNETIDNNLDDMFSNDNLTLKIRDTLRDADIPYNKKNALTEEILGLVEEDSKLKSEKLEFIKRAIAIYQGQATLGKIINRLIHEGRRPLSYFQNEIPNLKYWKEKYNSSQDEKYFSKVIERVDGVIENANHFVSLFKKIDPLATARRTHKKDENVKSMIKSSLNIFENDIKEQNIDVKILGSEKITYFCWKQDFLAIIYNLLENSIYWIVSTKCQTRSIEIEITENRGFFESVIYRDSGPGIKVEDIESLIIFSPGFSGKPDGGTGLGLSIAGEAAIRNDLKLQVEENNGGALFKIIKGLDSK